MLLGGFLYFLGLLTGGPDHLVGLVFSPNAIFGFFLNKRGLILGGLEKLVGLPFGVVEN